MGENTLNIGISLGRVRSFSEGLGEVGLQLMRRFAARAPQLRETHGVQFHFYARPALLGAFGDDFSYHAASRLHRVVHPSRARFALWHHLTQLDTTRAPMFTRRCVATVHDLNFLYAAPASETARGLRKLARLAERTDHLVCISNHTLDDLHRHLPAAPPSRVIYNGVSDLTTAPRSAPPDVAQALDGRPFLLHLSRMAPNKNVESLLPLARRWPEMAFVLAGGGDHAHVAALKAQCAAQALNNVFFCLGPDTAQKAWLYAQCHGFLFPSLCEGFGLPPLEAQLFGKPVFVAARTSLPEVCGDAAYYWSDFDAETMSHALRAHLDAFYAEPDAAQRVRAHALSYSWDRCAQSYLDMYLELCL